jgi:hypothetical protein
MIKRIWEKFGFLIRSQLIVIGALGLFWIVEGSGPSLFFWGFTGFTLFLDSGLIYMFLDDEQTKRKRQETKAGGKR